MVTLSNPEDVYASLALFSHTATVSADSELVFFSGQVSVHLDKSTPGTLPEQADQAFANVLSLLKAHGLTITNTARLTTYIVAGQDGQAVRTARQKHLGSHQPVSTLLYVSHLSHPAWVIELEVTAAKSPPVAPR